MCSLSLPCFLSSPPDSGSAPLTRPGLPPLRGGLTDSNASHDGASVQPHKKKKKEKCLRRLLSHITSCHYSAKPGPVNKQRLHLAAETHAASVNVITSHVACTRSLSITPSKQTISPLVLKSVQPRV